MTKMQTLGLTLALGILGAAGWAFFMGHWGWGIVGVMVAYGFAFSFGSAVKPDAGSYTSSAGSFAMDAIKVLDLRPAWEKQLGREVQHDLGGEDEEHARRLCALLRRHDQATAREIGETLYAQGGHRRMVRVCLRVKALGGDAAILERRVWDGVGEWMG